MWSFIVAGIIFVGTILLSALLFMAEMSKPIPDSNAGITATFITGTIISALVAASHWLPNLGW